MRSYARKFTVPQQYEALRGATIVQDGNGKFTRSSFSFECSVQPTPISRDYRLRITYSHKGTPRVFVVSPDLLELAGGRKLPHVYSQSPAQLCLYLPGSGEWTDGHLLAQTILPWAVLWLYYFEHWLITDQWEGGGVHPVEKTENTGKKKRIN